MIINYSVVTHTCYKMLEIKEFCYKGVIIDIISLKDIIEILNLITHKGYAEFHERHFKYFRNYQIFEKICRKIISMDNMDISLDVIVDLLFTMYTFSKEVPNSFSDFVIDIASNNPLKCTWILSVYGKLLIRIYSDIDLEPMKYDSIFQIIEKGVMHSDGMFRAKALDILLPIMKEIVGNYLERRMRINELPNYLLLRIFNLMLVKPSLFFNETYLTTTVKAIEIISFIVNLDLPKIYNPEEYKQKRDKLENLMVERRVNSSTIVGPIISTEWYEYWDKQDELDFPEYKSINYVLDQMMNFTSRIQYAFVKVNYSLLTEEPDILKAAISFFANTKLTYAGNVEISVRNILRNICSKDDSIREAVIDACRSIYLSNYQNNAQLVDSLSKLVANSTRDELTWIEKLIVNFIETDYVDHGLIECIWQRSRPNNEQYSLVQRKYALILFSMAANVDKSFISAYFNILINEIPPTDCEDLDLELMHYTCITIKNMARACKLEQLEKVRRLPEISLLCQRLVNLCVSTFTIDRMTDWIPMAMKSVEIIYLLAENPQIMCSEMMASFAKETYDGLGDENEKLKRFIGVASHISMEYYNHKQLDFIKEEKGEEKSLVAATADNAAVELMCQLSTTNLATDPHKFTTILIELVVHICSNTTLFEDDNLQTVAICSLGRLMLLGSRVCVAHIHLLFEFATHSTRDTIRILLIEPLGRLFLRFTAELESYTPRLYGLLHDENTDVRMKTLKLLAAFILHGVLKVDQHIYLMTTCVMDKYFRVAILAKKFFINLAETDRAPRKVMSDINNRLSGPDTGLSEMQIRIIKKLLTPFLVVKKRKDL